MNGCSMSHFLSAQGDWPRLTFKSNCACSLANLNLNPILNFVNSIHQPIIEKDLCGKSNRARKTRQRTRGAIVLRTRMADMILLPNGRHTYYCRRPALELNARDARIAFSVHRYRLRSAVRVHMRKGARTHLTSESYEETSCSPLPC